MCVCLCVSHLKWDFFWLSMPLAQIWYGASCSNWSPTGIWLYRGIIVVKSCENVSVSCIESYEGQYFSDVLFDS